MKKKLKKLVSLLIAITLIMALIPAESAYADSSFVGSGIYIPRRPTPSGGRRTVTTKRRVVPSPVPSSARTGWRMYLVTSDDPEGNVNPRIMEGTDVIDVLFSRDWIDDVDAAAMWTRVADGEATRAEDPISLGGSNMPTPYVSSAYRWFTNETDGLVNGLR